MLYNVDWAVILYYNEHETNAAIALQIHADVN